MVAFRCILEIKVQHVHHCLSSHQQKASVETRACITVLQPPWWSDKKKKKNTEAVKLTSTKHSILNRLYLDHRSEGYSQAQKKYHIDVMDDHICVSSFPALTHCRLGYQENVMKNNFTATCLSSLVVTSLLVSVRLFYRDISVELTYTHN